MKEKDQKIELAKWTRDETVEPKSAEITEADLEEVNGGIIIIGGAEYTKFSKHISGPIFRTGFGGGPH